MSANDPVIEILGETVAAARGAEVRRILGQSVSDALQSLKWIEFRRDIVLHNLANVNTIGFKKMDPWTWNRIFAQGSFRQTENQFSAAIEGKGFFQIRLPSGATAFTRAGSWELDATGNIAIAGGLLLEPAITVDPKAVNVEINSEGVVTQQLPDATLVQIGQIQLVDFVNPAGLTTAWDVAPTGVFLFRETSASGAPRVRKPGQEGIGAVRQGFVEISNVNIREEEAALETLRHQEEAILFGLEAAGYRLPRH